MSVAALEYPRPRHTPITVGMYHFMAEKGMFEPDERVELIGGEIFTKPQARSLHVRCSIFLSNFFTKTLGDSYIVSVNNPIIASEYSEPEPDLTILYPKDDLYRNQLPTGNETAIVVEIADTTAFFDRNTKFPLYADAGIPEAWLIDLKRDAVEIHSDPGPYGYGDVKTFHRDERVASLLVPAIDLSVDDILG